jgi:hypothetical protein
VGSVQEAIDCLKRQISSAPPPPEARMEDVPSAIE